MSTYFCLHCKRTSYDNGGRPICVYCKRPAPYDQTKDDSAPVVIQSLEKEMRDAEAFERSQDS